MSKLDLRQDEPLKPYTTFKIGGPARFFASARSRDDFSQALQFARQKRLPTFILGGGSNLLVSDHGFDGLVIHPVRKGVAVEAEPSGAVILRVEAGETWDDVVGYAVARGWWGIENLSHIPGQAGAALVQNIGAYGQQISDAFESAEVMEVRSSEGRTLEPADCRLSYRRSIFNTTAKSEFIILGLQLRLSRRGEPNLDYPDVSAYFSQRGIRRPSLAEIREAIIRIRDRKFPFPRQEKGGNAGSFFKNLLLPAAEFAALRDRIQHNFSHRELDRLEQIQKRSVSAEEIKIPTAFLIEICGLKGYRAGNAQVNENQPLVLLNQGGATAEDVLKLAGHLRRAVYARTGLTLWLEPELIGFTPEEVEKYLALE